MFFDNTAAKVTIKIETAKQSLKKFISKYYPTNLMGNILASGNYPTISMGNILVSEYYPTILVGNISVLKNYPTILMGNISVLGNYPTHLMENLVRSLAPWFIYLLSYCYRNLFHVHLRIVLHAFGEPFLEILITQFAWRSGIAVNLLV